MTGIGCGLGAGTGSCHDAAGLVMGCVAETGSRCDQVAGRCTPSGEGW